MKVELPPSTVDALAAGRAAFAEGHYAEALYHFGQVIAADAGSAWGWHGRGDALQLLGAHEDARDAYDTAASLQPGEPLHAAGAARARRSLREKAQEG
ncbi:MAG: Flp pilus assembly protein TadD [Myxococcota bacterium]|jgi:Flp pilus assembly protein TadD